MKGEFDINLINNETYFNEFFDSAISSLEKIENYKNVLFNRLNNALTLRVNKLCNLKSRINRINQILATYPAINKAITIKSKFHYPTKDHSYYTPVAYVENSDNIVITFLIHIFHTNFHLFVLLVSFFLSFLQVCFCIGNISIFI